jgi:hypothetical protein
MSTDLEDHHGGDAIDEIFASARELDPEAWAARDRLWQERAENPDRMDQVPRNAAERRMSDRRMRSIAVATDRDLDSEGILSLKESNNRGALDPDGESASPPKARAAHRRSRVRMAPSAVLRGARARQDRDGHRRRSDRSRWRRRRRGNPS